jgi:hypothetical protein
MVDFTFNDKSIAARLTQIGPDVTAALTAAIGPLVAEMKADVVAREAAHIRFMGAEPGAFLAQIQSGVSTKNSKRITGYVRSSKPTIHYAGRDIPLAQVLEYGATIPAHLIMPKVAKALHFTASLGERFARIVHSPGAKVPAYPAFKPALAAAAPRAKAALAAAISRASPGP